MDLTAEVLRYQRTGEGLVGLVAEIRAFVYQFPASNRCSCDAAELLLRFEARIPTLIRRYRHTGQTFESYLASSLRWQIRTMAREQARNNIRQTALVGEGSHLRTGRDTWNHNSPEVHESDQPLTPVTLPRGQSRRLIYMALKLTERLCESDYRRVAHAAGCDAEWLLRCWQQLRQECTIRRERQMRYRERRDKAWFRVRCIQYRLQLVLDREEQEAAHRQLAKWRRRHLYAVRLLSRMRSFPTHAEIAAAVGVPKGSVDSSLFYGKQQLEHEEYRRYLANALGNP